MDTNILLESGTNELEVLEFTLGNNHYGINVAKIREILTYQPVTPVPNSHPSVEGIFMPRDTMITVVNLKRCLGMPEDGENKGLFIITNFNKLNIAFHVDAVIGIHRVSWESIIKPDSTINTENNSASTGVIKMDDKLIIILDFEKIVSDISPETGLKVSNLYIAQVKDKHGLEKRENYNLSKSEDARQPKCPKEKEKAIEDALRHFQMILLH
jgi:two-component system chemotaxis response regulator CheV